MPLSFFVRTSKLVKKLVKQKPAEDSIDLHPAFPDYLNGLALII